MSKVHLACIPKSVYNDYVSKYYAACGIMIGENKKSKYIEHNKDTLNPKEVTCKNCKKTSYYKERVKIQENINKFNKNTKDIEPMNNEESLLEQIEDLLQRYAEYLGTDEGRTWMSRVFLVIVILGIILYIL